MPIMKKICTLIFISCSLLSYAQKQYASAFAKAYKKYPAIPAYSLEALAYANSRMQNMRPVDIDAADKHQPAHFGLFALVEDGQGYWKNNLETVCSFSHISSSGFKRNASVQIMAVASYINNLCVQYNVHSLADMAPVFDAFAEIPANTTINKYALDLYKYEVYYHLTHGFSAAGITVPVQSIEPGAWFTPETFHIISAAEVTIQDGKIFSGDETYQPSSPAGILSTDYPPALWTSSPNYSSRGGTAISAVTIHTTEGSYAGTISWFQNTSSQVSAHYVMRSVDGQVTQMVREYNKAWHVGSENPYTIGIEHEGFVSQTGWYTTAMYSSSASLVKDICAGNNIDPKTCYNGPSSSSVQVLSSSIKIKGHQHFPNQTHTDPGINWNWPYYYGLINPSSSSCNTTSTMNESFISTSFANLNWSSVSGATGYTLQWKKSSATTWTTVQLTVNYYTINNLSASTSYQWRVQTKCSGGNTSAYSATRSFTTKASCWDGNEPNNVYTSPTPYSFAGTYMYGKICGSGDVDFYKITTTTTGNITIKVQTLPANYNLETYTSNGTYIGGSYATGTQDESYTLTNKPAGTYLFRVYGQTSGDYNSLKDYRLQVITGAFASAMQTASMDDAWAISPNPVHDVMYVTIHSNHTQAAKLIITDISGRVLQETALNNMLSSQTVTLPVDKLAPGIYFCSLINKDGKTTTRFVKE